MTRDADTELDPDLFPFDDGFSAAQIAALLALLEQLGPAPRRVLDLGCGAGRTAMPLVAKGHALCGLDRDPAALAVCRSVLGVLPAARWDLYEADFLGPWPELGRFDAVCCLGNTFMTVADVGAAAVLLGRAAAVLEPDGVVVLDDGPGEFWPELTEGRWTSGVSEDGTMQLVWAPDDAVFALRRGAAVDAESWAIGPGEPRFRLWTMGALALAGRAAGLSEATRVPGGGLLIMRSRGV